MVNTNNQQQPPSSTTSTADVSGISTATTPNINTTTTNNNEAAAVTVVTSTPSQSPVSPSSSSPSSKSTEQTLREELLKLRKKLSKREPLDPSYNFLLLKNSYVKPPKIHKLPKSLYKQEQHFFGGANLREAVEIYMNKYGTETPAMDSRKGTVGRHRNEFDEGAMKDAFTIRECKEHEQRELIQASLHAANARRRPGSFVNEGVRKRKIEAMALGLQEGERKRKQREKDRKLLIAARQKMLDAETKLLEMQKSKTSDVEETARLDEKLRQAEQQKMNVQEREMEERERARVIETANRREKELEKERILAEKKEKERQKREREVALRRARKMETPQQALHRLYEPIFTSLWDMEFWDGLNPFRIVIDKTNCADMGAPDYCEVIKKPMNLTYIREKVEKKSYTTLQAFFGDVELLINNALLYNSDPSNPYHVAAQKMKSKYIELRKKLMLQIEVSQST